MFTSLTVLCLTGSVLVSAGVGFVTKNPGYGFLTMGGLLLIGGFFKYLEADDEN